MNRKECRSHSGLSPTSLSCVFVPLQMGVLRAERDQLAQHNSSLVNTTQQLINAAADNQASSSSDNSSRASSEAGSARQTANNSNVHSQNADGTAAVAPPKEGDASRGGSRAGSGSGPARISRSQLKEIANMLQRLTHENAALIKARDQAAAELGPLQEEVRKMRGELLEAEHVVAAAEESQAAGAEAEGIAMGELGKLRGLLKRMSVERDKLISQVGLLLCY